MPTYKNEKCFFMARLYVCKRLKISEPLYFQFFPLIIIWRSTIFHNHRAIKQLEENPATILFQHTNMFIDKAVIPLNNLST